MIKVASFENEANEQEQRSIQDKQTMFVGADNNDLTMLTKSWDTLESFPLTNQEHTRGELSIRSRDTRGWGS